MPPGLHHALSPSPRRSATSLNDFHAIDPSISPIQQRRHPRHRQRTPDKQHDPLRGVQDLEQRIRIEAVMTET